MGEIVKKLGKVTLYDGIETEFELNSSTSGKGEQIVHIQNEGFRAEFSRRDFIQNATAIIAAAYQLKKLKKIKNG